LAIAYSDPLLLAAGSLFSGPRPISSFTGNGIMARQRYLALWDLTRGHRGRYAAAIGALFAGVGIGMTVPLAVRRAIDDVVLGSAPTQQLPAMAALIVFLTVLSAAAIYAKGRWAAEAAHGISRRVREHLFDHLQHLPCSYFDRAESGDLLQRCTSDVETLRTFLSTQLVQIGRAVIMLLILVPLLTWLDARMMATSMLIVPVIIGTSIWFFRRITTLYERAEEAESAMTSVLQENLSGIRVAWAFGRREFEIERFAEKAVAFRDRSLAVAKLIAPYWGISDLLCMTQVGLVLLVGAAWSADGSLSVGTYVAFISYVNMLMWPIRQMGRILAEQSKALVAMGRIEEILQVEREADGLRAATRGARPGRLEVRRLSFTYADGTRALRDLSFTVETAETLAIIGPPGAGKSTLIHLLLRLYDYDEGSITLDGDELSEMGRRTVRQRIGAALQDPFIFSRTVSDNIRLGREQAEEVELHQAAETAYIHRAIEAFEEGYETMVGEKGVTLSGGQRQRLSLARSILADPDLLILDDALSAVDTRTEGRIRDALQARRGRRSTIVIAHRLSTLAHADRVLVLSEGELRECGGHAELLRMDGAYARLWRLQSRFEEELADDLTLARKRG
jgi:ATP-binding cassette subfamily B protein